jgi:hypothetical protein
LIKHRFILELLTDDDLTPLDRYEFDRAVIAAIGDAVRALKESEDFFGGSHVKTEHLLED